MSDDREDGDDVQNPKPRLSQSESNILAMIAAGIRAENAPPPPPKPTWASLPAVLGVATAVISIVGAAAAVLQGYTQLGDRVQSFGERMLANDARIAMLEREFQARGHQRDGEVATLTSNNALQDDRLRNFAVALEQERQARTESEADIRRSEAEARVRIDDLAKAMSEIRSDLKVLVDRAQRHAGDPLPERDAQAMQGR